MQGKLPLIIGLGLTGKSLLDHLSKSHNKLFVVSESETLDEINEIKRAGTEIHFNPSVDETLMENISVIYPSPGVPDDHQIMKLARKKGVSISSDIELFLKINKCLKILITGTNGKTTTSIMMGNLFQYFYPTKSIKVLGNIGTPVLNHLNDEIDIAIIEVSSFQLELLNQVEFDIGVLLNIEDDHLDRHKTIEQYTKIKHKVLEFSRLNISFNDLNLFDKDFINFNDIDMPTQLRNSSFFGLWPTHDLINLKASISSLLYFSKFFDKKTFELSYILEKLEDCLLNFSKPSHRFEYIGNFNEINYINDSKATNLHSMHNAINSVIELKNEGELFLICGGDLKGQDVSLLDKTAMSMVKEVVIFGKDKYLMAEQIGKYTFCSCVENLSEAVSKASKIANRDDYILFSPACSSTDMFKNFEERGDRFKELVSLMEG